MAKQPKKMTRAEKTLLASLNNGGRLGMNDNGTANKLIGRGLVKYFGQGVYRLTDEGKKHVLDT